MLAASAKIIGFDEVVMLGYRDSGMADSEPNNHPDCFHQAENASMLGSRSWLLASTTDGNLVVARADPQKYEEVRRYQIAQSALWAHPAITGSSIIVKDVDKVICWSF